MKKKLKYPLMPPYKIKISDIQVLARFPLWKQLLLLDQCALQAVDCVSAYVTFALLGNLRDVVIGKTGKTSVTPRFSYYSCKALLLLQMAFYYSWSSQNKIHGGAPECGLSLFFNQGQHWFARSSLKVLSYISNYTPVDLHWFFETSISAFISNWDKNSVIN